MQTIGLTLYWLLIAAAGLMVIGAVYAGASGHLTVGTLLVDAVAVTMLVVAGFTTRWWLTRS